MMYIWSFHASIMIHIYKMWQDNYLKRTAHKRRSASWLININNGIVWNQPSFSLNKIRIIISKQIWAWAGDTKAGF